MKYGHALLILVALASTAAAQCPDGRCGRRSYRPTYVYAPTYASYTYAPSPASVSPAPVAASPPSADPYHFGSWLNAVRASRGLRPLAFDPGLASLAAANSSVGAVGHWGYNPGRENSGMGALGAVESMWLASPPHAAALLDPGVSTYGIARVGSIWTYNAR